MWRLGKQNTTRCDLPWISAITSFTKRERNKKAVSIVIKYNSHSEKNEINFEELGEFIIT